MPKDLSRQDFLRLGLRGFLREARQKPGDAPAPEQAPVPLYLRPPGAIPEPAFTETCERCGKCVEACHQGSIVPLPEALGTRLGCTPAIFPNRQPCFLCTDVPCAAVCPSGALRPLSASAVRLGTAVLRLSRCIAAGGEECDHCIEACPYPGDAIFVSGPGGVPVVDAEHCTGCGLCVMACPTDPHRAIAIRPAWMRPRG